MICVSQKIGQNQTDFSESGTQSMAQLQKAAKNLLMPSPKELDKALTLSADRARRMAEAFGLKVPGVAPQPEKTYGSAVGPRRATKA